MKPAAITAAWTAFFLAVIWGIHASFSPRSIIHPRTLLADTLDLGNVLPGQKVSGVLTVTNLGWQRLEIRPVSQCSCVPVQIERSGLAWHESTDVRFALDAPKQFGAFTKEIRLLTNDARHNGRPVVVGVHGTIDKGVVLDPAIVDMGWVVWGRKIAKQVTLRSRPDMKAPLILGCSSPLLSASLQSVTPGESQLTLEACHPLHSGELEATVFVQTGNPEQMNLSIDVKAHFGGAMKASPGEVVLRKDPADARWSEGKTRIEARSEGQMTLAATPPESAVLQFELSPIEGEPQAAMLYVRPGPALDADAAVRSEARIGFSDPNGNTDSLIIPVAAY